MTTSYTPDLPTQRAIIEQALRELHTRLEIIKYQLRVEQRVAPVVGEASAQQIKLIEHELRVMAARIEAYSELLAELRANVAPANGVHA